VFIVSLGSITTEAQNALLKLLEEPPKTALYYIVIPREDMLIPTLRSRLSKESEDENGVVSEEAHQFLKSSYKERLETVALQTKDKANDGWADKVLEGVEVFLKEKRDYEGLKEIAFLRKYFYGRSA